MIWQIRNLEKFLVGLSTKLAKTLKKQNVEEDNQLAS